MGFLKKLFGGKKQDEKTSKDFTAEQHEQDYELKKQGLEDLLGEIHPLVGHAIIPFSVGGAVDMYYFPKHIEGTGFATMELIDPDGNGPLPNRIGTYELVAFTKKPIDSSEEANNPFNLIERRICGIFTSIGNYSSMAVLNPNETCEIPDDDKPNICLVFDNYNPSNKEFKIGNKKHCLLLCIEVFRSEMEFSREYGSDQLFDLLKKEGYYPYSDMDRKPVA